MADGRSEERRFNTYRFLRAFISELVLRDHTTICPKLEDDRAGFHRVLSAINQSIEKAKTDLIDREYRSALVKIRNSLAMSNNGSFDNFEAALRDMQLALTSCPNHEYDEIKFEISKPFAESELQQLSASERALVKQTAEAFLVR